MSNTDRFLFNSHFPHEMLTCIQFWWYAPHFSLTTNELLSMFIGWKMIRLQVWSFRICGTSPPPSHTLQNKQCYHLDMIPLLHSVCLVLGLQSNVVDASIASLSHQTFTKLVCYATIVTGIFISCMMETHLNWAYKRKKINRICSHMKHLKKGHKSIDDNIKFIDVVYCQNIST